MELKNFATNTMKIGKNGLDISVSESLYDDDSHLSGSSLEISLKLIGHAFNNLALESAFKKIKQTFCDEESGGFELGYFGANNNILKSVSFQYISSQLPCVFVSQKGKNHKVSYSGGAGYFFYFLLKEIINLTSEALKNGKQLEGTVQAGHIKAIFHMAASLKNGSFSLDSIRVGRITHHDEKKDRKFASQKLDFMIENEKIYENYFKVSLAEMNNIIEYFFITHEIMHVLLEHISNPGKQEYILNKTYYASKYNLTQKQEIQADMYAAQHICMAYNYLFEADLSVQAASSKVMSTLCWLYKFYEISEYLSEEDPSKVPDQPKAIDRWNEIKWGIYGYDALRDKAYMSDDIVDDIERLCNVIVDIAKRDKNYFL